MILFVLALLAQQGVATERARGLTVDFVAVQADGAPVPDLRAGDVEIRIGDRLRTIRSLRRVAAAPAVSPRMPRPYGTNSDVVSGRRFILVVDQESFRAGGEQVLRNAVEGLVAQMGPLDAAMVAALPFGGIRVPWTPDGARIRRGIDGIAGQGSSTETGSELACRTRRLLESLEGFLGDQPAAVRPSTLVIFTAGLAAPRRDAAMAMAPGMCELVPDQFRRLTGLASAARVNVYVAVPVDIKMNAVQARESISGAGYLGSDNPLEGIEHFEGVTGATRLPLDATGTASLLRLGRESSAYYEAELEPERNDVFGRSRPFAVKVQRRDITVRARPEIVLSDPSRKTAAARLTVPDLLGSFEAVTELPLRVAGFTVREASDRLRVGVVVETVDPAASLISVGAILISPEGGVVGRWFAKDASERPLLGAIAAVPGTYTLRVAALDTAGRAGVAEDSVQVSLVQAGPVSLGALMLGVSRPEGLRPQLEFSTEPSAIASFDLFGGSPQQRLAAVLEVARDPGSQALITLPVTLSRVDESRVTATGTLPIGALPPGDYVVRGIVRLEDGTIGLVTRTLRKVAR